MEKWTNINEKQILVKEFDGKRVITFKDVDLVHERADGTASRNFRTNKKHFIENEDFYKITPKDFQSDEIRRFGINSPRGGILLTETGYLMLVKSFTDDLAWKVQRELVNVYFNVHHSEEKQLKIQEPCKLTKKIYKNKPVMVLKDLEAVTNIPVHNLSYYLRNKDFTIGVHYFLLEGKELKKFKKHNKVSPLIGVLIIITKEGANKLINLLKPKLDNEARTKIDDYFKVEKPIVSDKAPVLEQLKVCKFIADDLEISEASKISIYKSICEKNGIDSMVVDRIEKSKKLDKELKTASLRLIKYLSENNTVDEIKAIEEECVLGSKFASCSKEARKFILNLFDYIIKISKENTKPVVV